MWGHCLEGESLGLTCSPTVSEGAAGADDVHSPRLTGPTSPSSLPLSGFLLGRPLQYSLLPDHSNEIGTGEGFVWAPVQIPDPRGAPPQWPTEEEQMVLNQMITVEALLTASNTDFLAGTQLDQPGVPGAYTVWAASTVGDTTITVSLGGRTITDGATVVQRAFSEIRENEDTFYQVISPTGGRPIVNITEVTAATIRVRVKFIPAFAT